MIKPLFGHSAFDRRGWLILSFGKGNVSSHGKGIGVSAFRCIMRDFIRMDAYGKCMRMEITDVFVIYFEKKYLLNFA